MAIGFTQNKHGTLKSAAYVSSLGTRDICATNVFFSFDESALIQIYLVEKKGISKP